MSTKSRGGYTILEVLVAVIILAIVLPGLTVLVVGSRKTQVSSLRFENAAAYGQQVYDQLSLLPPAKVTATGSQTTTIDGQTYTASWVATPNVNSSSTPIGGKKITITVGWTVGGKPHSSVLAGALP